jgi:hypothetical protein
MPYIIYLKNNQNKEIVLCSKTFHDSATTNRMKGRVERALKKEGYQHITVHEKKI